MSGKVLALVLFVWATSLPRTSEPAPPVQRDSTLTSVPAAFNSLLSRTSLSTTTPTSPKILLSPLAKIPSTTTSTTKSSPSSSSPSAPPPSAPPHSTSSHSTSTPSTSPPTTFFSFFRNYGAIGVFGLLFLLGFFFCFCCFCCPCITLDANVSERQHLLEKENKNDHIISLWTLLCSRRTDKCTFIDETDRTSVIVRNEKRINVSIEEKENADLISKQFFELFQFDYELEDIGSRLQKYWYLRHNNVLLQFTAKKSTRLPFPLSKCNIKALKNLFHSLQHQFLLQIEDIEFKGGYVSVIMEKINSGSLRDIIYKASPTGDWEVKYRAESQRYPFSVEEIKTCGSHVLQAVDYLYGLRIQAIGQIHCGNVFFKDGYYLLGGYENVFLGYKTSIYSMIAAEGLLSHIDLIMFGLMIYEMYTGMLPEKIVMEKTDLVKIKHQEVKDILLFIFGKKLRNKRRPIKTLLQHKFFHCSGNSKTEPLFLSEDAKTLLEVMAPQLFAN